MRLHPRYCAAISANRFHRRSSSLGHRSGVPQRHAEPAPYSDNSIGELSSNCPQSASRNGIKSCRNSTSTRRRNSLSFPDLSRKLSAVNNLQKAGRSNPALSASTYLALGKLCLPRALLFVLRPPRRHSFWNTNIPHIFGCRAASEGRSDMMFVFLLAQ